MSAWEGLNPPYATIVADPPYTILDGASSTETEPLAIINELADVGGVVVCQSSFTMTTEAGTASFIGTVIAFP